MKINELLQEQQVDEVGVLQGIKGAVQGVTGGLSGIKGGYAAGKAAGVEQDLINRTVQKAMASWGQQQQRLKTAGTAPTVQDATAWFAQFARQQPTSNPAGVGPGQITPWLQKEIASYLVSKNSAQAAPTQPEQPKQPEQPQQPAQQAKPIETGSKTRAGTEVIKPEPLTLKYKNQTYVRGAKDANGKETGEWSKFGTTKPLPPNEQAFFDSEEDELGTAQPQAAAQPETPRGIQATVATDAGYVYKKEDGNWYREDGTKVNAYDEIEDLEQKWMDARATARAKGQERDAAQTPPPVPGAPDISTLSKEELKQLLQVLQGPAQ